MYLNRGTVMLRDIRPLRRLAVLIHFDNVGQFLLYLPIRIELRVQAQAHLGHSIFGFQPHVSQTAGGAAAAVSLISNYRLDFTKVRGEINQKPNGFYTDQLDVPNRAAAAMAFLPRAVSVLPADGRHAPCWNWNFAASPSSNTL